MPDQLRQVCVKGKVLHSWSSVGLTWDKADGCVQQSMWCTTVWKLLTWLTCELVSRFGLQRFLISAILWKICTLVDANLTHDSPSCGVAVAATSNNANFIFCNLVSPRMSNMLWLYVWQSIKHRAAAYLYSHLSTEKCPVQWFASHMWMARYHFINSIYQICGLLKRCTKSNWLQMLSKLLRWGYTSS